MKSLLINGTVNDAIQMFVSNGYRVVSTHGPQGELYAVLQDSRENWSCWKLSGGKDIAGIDKTLVLFVGNIDKQQRLF